MAEEVNSYEEQRRRQVEENRRKLEELRLHHLSAAVRAAAAAARPKPKPKPRRVVPPPGELRRSGRVGSRPDQREVYEAYAVRIGPTVEERARAIAKAEELKRRIHCIRWPAFVKPMTPAAVSIATHMRIPKDFVTENFTRYLPAHDEPVVVVDEEGEEFHMMYRAKRVCKIDKGWKEFADRQDLAYGDCLVFQLTERAKFKIMEGICVRPNHEEVVFSLLLSPYRQGRPIGQAKGALALGPRTAGAPAQVYIFRASPDYESDQTSDDDVDED